MLRFTSPGVLKVSAQLRLEVTSSPQTKDGPRNIGPRWDRVVMLLGVEKDKPNLMLFYVDLSFMSHARGFLWNRVPGLHSKSCG